MAIYTNLPIYKASYSLLLEVSKMQKDLSKDSRYTIGQELRERIMHMIILIYRASRSKHKISIIAEMRESLLEAQVYIRLLSDMRNISEGRYAALAEQTSSISKQLVAWERSEREKDKEQRERSDGQQPAIE